MASAGQVDPYHGGGWISRQTRWLFGGAALQGLVLMEDYFTPLGFADGVLYALPIAVGTMARSQRTIVLLTLLGLAGVVAGVYVSQGRLAGVDDGTIWLNRSLGAGCVVVAGIVASIVLRLLRHRDASHATLKKSAGLLEVANSVGKLGGWQVELPGREAQWSNEVFQLLDHPIGRVPDLAAVFGLYTPEDRQRIRAAFEACVATGTPFDEEVQLDHGDGAGKWLRVVGEAVRAADGRVLRVQGAIQDIEGFKQTEQALERSRAEWRAMTDSLPMMVWVSSADGDVTYLNRYMAEYVATDDANLLGAGWVQFLHPADQEGTVMLWQAALASGNAYEAEFRVRRADGEWRWHFARAVRLRVSSGQHCWYGTAMDVQAMRDEREARTRLSDRLVDTMESVGDAIFMLDHDWRVSYLNRQAEFVLERPREALLGRNVWEAFPEARGTEFQQQYERCVRDRVTVRFEHEYTPLGKRVEVNAYPVDDGIAVYFRDVTEQRRLAEQLDQAQRMDSLGQLTGGVAHDFNNLLTVILGNAELLSEQHDAGEEQRALAAMIVEAASRGADLTRRLLTFARKQVLEPEPADINQLIEQFVPLLKRTLGEHIEIALAPAPDLWRGLVDPGRLEIALLNLAVNARDAMPEGGRLIIETSNAWLDEAYAASRVEVKPGPYVVLAVSDSGHGIPPRLLGRVFEPFFTTKALGHGTGLGLAMVYGFAKQSRGHVSIYSEVDRGTTVRIYLPRVVKEDGQPAMTPTQAEAGPAQEEVVLLVEDDEQVRAFARTQVASLGYRVLEAASGGEALGLLRDHPEVALLFTDVVMAGGMSGPQLADAARALRPGLPVLYTSGYTENAMLHQGGLHRGELLLGKPYRRADLAGKLRAALGARAQY